MDRRQRIAEQRKQHELEEALVDLAWAAFWLCVNMVLGVGMDLICAQLLLFILAAFTVPCGFFTALLIVLLAEVIVGAPHVLLRKRFRK